IDDGRVDVGEHLELVGAADVVAVARRAVGDQPLAVADAHLARLERFDHAVLFRHAADPFVALDGHGNGEWGMGNGEWGLGIGEWEMAHGEPEMGNRRPTRESSLSTIPHSPFPTHVSCTTIFGIPNALLRARRLRRPAVLRAISR